jgi:hypothetical protein
MIQGACVFFLIERQCGVSEIRLHNSIVIPGQAGEKLQPEADPSLAEARPGIQEFQRHLDIGLCRYDGRKRRLV